MHIILHIILHILHIIIDAYCAHCAHCTLHIVHIVHILDEKVIHRGFIVYCHYCLVPHPRAQLFKYHHLQPSPLIADFISETWSSGKVSRFSTHGEGFCPCRTHRNKRKASQYGGNWNHIQSVSVCLFTVFVDNYRLTLIQPGWGRILVDKLIRICKICIICRICQYGLIFVGPCTLPAPCISKLGSAYILLICKIWTLHYSAYWFWGLHIVLHIDAYICKTICTIC